MSEMYQGSRESVKDEVMRRPFEDQAQKQKQGNELSYEPHNLELVKDVGNVTQPDQLGWQLNRDEKHRLSEKQF